VQGAPYASITEALRSKLPSLGTTAWIAAIVLIAAYLLMAAGIPASELPQAAAFVVALIWLLLWAIATVFMPRTVSKPKYAVAVLIVLTIAISIAAQGYRHNAEEKSARTQRTPGPRVPATVDQKPPAECATAKNVEECADTASGQPTKPTGGRCLRAEQVGLRLRYEQVRLTAASHESTALGRDESWA
jgi:hypothetical protein